jgi:hypothetical protein
VSRDPLPADAETEYLCLSGRNLTIIHAVFSSKEKAEAWRDAANIWHGEGHPLVPIRVEPVKKDIRPFPAAALQQLTEATEAGEPTDDALRAMFDTLLDGPEPAPRQGGRR